jgi:hypothetical protein
MLGIYRVAAQLVASRVVLSSKELVSGWVSPQDLMDDCTGQCSHFVGLEIETLMQELNLL